MDDEQCRGMHFHRCIQDVHWDSFQGMPSIRLPLWRSASVVYELSSPKWLGTSNLQCSTFDQIEFHRVNLPVLCECIVVRYSFTWSGFSDAPAISNGLRPANISNNSTPKAHQSTEKPVFYCRWKGKKAQQWKHC